MNNREDDMQDFRTFNKVDIDRWVLGTIEKVKRGAKWKEAWQQTYRQIGGKSDETMKKGCPMKGAQTLYELGRIKVPGKIKVLNRIKAPGRKRKNTPLREVLNDYSKNGVYAVLALDELGSNPNISLPDLWENIQKRVRKDLSEEPAKSNQGGPTVAFKLWHLKLAV